MSTYSYGNAPTDALKLSNINDVLSGLPDNTSKLISPKDVRDAVYTLWENIMFKPTTSTGAEYIGIDQETYTNKVYFGKKKEGGQFVMTNSLLSTDTDFFFYNTKTASGSFNTKIAFLAGTGSNYQNSLLSAPYIQSTVVSNMGFTNTLDFEINNSSYFTSGLTSYGGHIRMRSQYGNIYLNGVRWPTYLDNTVGPQNDYVLKYKFISGEPRAVWEAAVTVSAVTDLFSAGTVSITGSPVILNGLPINFTYDIPTPVSIGAIQAGETFSNVPVTEMIRRLLYPYIAPEVTASLNYQFIEVGDALSTSQVTFNFTVYKNATYSISSLAYSFTPSALLSPPPTPISLIPNGLNNYSVRPIVSNTIGTTQSYASYTYSVSLSDTYPTNISATTDILYVVLPWYYGTATVSAINNAGLTTINSILGTSSNYIPGKLTPILTEPVLSVTSSYNKTLPFTTLGLQANNPNEAYFYFGYPADFPDLSSVVDPNGFTTSDFMKFDVASMSHPNLYWFFRNYKFYIFVGSGSSSTPVATTIGSTPDYIGNYTFKFA